MIAVVSWHYIRVYHVTFSVLDATRFELWRSTMPDDWKTTKAQISRFLFTNPGKYVSAVIPRDCKTFKLIIHKQLNQKSATGAVVFNPSDYCPYSEDCISF